jgi:hypothetical protein
MTLADADKSSVTYAASSDSSVCKVTQRQLDCDCDLILAADPEKNHPSAPPHYCFIEIFFSPI